MAQASMGALSLHSWPLAVHILCALRYLEWLCNHVSQLPARAWGQHS